MRREIASTYSCDALENTSVPSSRKKKSHRALEPTFARVTARDSPPPNAANGGRLIGSLPVIALAPSKARAAANCDAGLGPHAIMYDEALGACCSKYGVPNDTSTSRALRARSCAMKSRNAFGAHAVAVVELMFTYEPTTTTSTESARRSSR